MAAELPKILSINLFNSNESVQLTPRKPSHPLSQHPQKCYKKHASIKAFANGTLQMVSGNSALSVLRFLLILNNYHILVTKKRLLWIIQEVVCVAQ